MHSVPDVLHVGFSKCASTYLQTFFQQHPELFLVIKSHFFTPFEHCSFESSPDTYYNLFKTARSNQICLESDEHILLPVHHPVLDSAATTLESVSEVSQRIKSVQPKAKIILVVRNQVDLIVSRYSEYLLAGGKLGFDNFVGEFLACGEDGKNYYQNYYSRILDIFEDDFSPPSVLILLQEEFQRDEADTVRQICQFLGIAVRQTPGDDLRSRRVGLSRRGMKMMRGLNRRFVIRPAKSYKRAEVRFPYFLYKACQVSIRIADHYLPKSMKGDKKELLCPEIVARIRGEFAQDNARHAEMLGKDLLSLGY